jgi:selenocysteine lyase/cysteine desulfurase
MKDFFSDFHDFDGAVYLNCAYHGAMPRVATRAIQEALRLKQTPHLIRDEYHFSFADDYRAAVAELIGADPADVAVADSSTHGIMILVSGLDWKAGEEVLLPAGEFPANRFPWMSLEARGVSVREVDLGDGSRAPALLAEAMTERTRVVAASWVQYSTGSMLDIQAIGALCRERGALFAIDAAQAIGGLPFSVQAVPVDLVACAGYKWLLGPYGTGFSWVHPELSERLASSNINWISLDGASDFSRLSECELAFPPGARRFDVNEPASFLNMAGATASTRYLIGVTPALVRRHVLALQERLLADLPEGMKLLGPEDPAERSNILCFSAGSEANGDRIAQRLFEERIFLSRREGALRISPHIYNTQGDIDRLLAVLRG